MNEIAIFSAIVNLLWALGAFLLAWGSLRVLDIMGGHPFAVWLENASNETLGVYYSYRILAVCILFGLVVRPPV